MISLDERDLTFITLNTMERLNASIAVICYVII